MWSSTPSRADTAPTCPPVRGPALVLSLSLLCGGPALANATQASAALPAAPAAADTPQGASHAQLPGSRLQGQATLRYFGLRVYHARLWTLPEFRTNQPVDQPVVLELEYLRDLQGSAIAERSLKEMQRAGPLPDVQARRWLADMQRIFPDVKAGDRITGLHLPGQGMRFWHNGRAAGQVDDTAFARLFLGIWLAPTTSEPELRLALLGLGDSGIRR